MSIRYGECLYIPFYNKESIADSQLRPRMYKTKEAFEKMFPCHNFRNTEIELVKYVPVIEEESGEIGIWGTWQYYRKENTAICPFCNEELYLGTIHQFASRFCPGCGHPMKEIT